MARGSRVVTASYYAVLGLLLLLAVTGRAGDLLPGFVGKHVGEDSEGVLLAIVLPAWIQFARPRLAGTRREWPVTALAVAVLAALGAWMYATGPIPGNVETLNEPLFALALLTLYVQLPRPLPRALVVGVVAACLLLFVTAAGWQPGTSLAELLAMIVLVPAGLDLVDRAVLDPSARTSGAVRWTWYAFLLAMPVVVSTVLAGAFTGAAGEAVTYLSRVQEAWLGVLLVELYFAVGHGRVGPEAHASPAGDGDAALPAAASPAPAAPRGGGLAGGAPAPRGGVRERRRDARG